MAFRSPHINKKTAFLLLAVVGMLAYSNTFNAPFQWDDKYTFLAENPIVKDIGYFTEPSTAEGLKLYEALRRRYVGYLTFALNYRLHGLNVAGFHAFNLFVHVLNAFFVFLFVSLTFRTPLMERSSLKSRTPLIAFFTALFFVSHPVQTEAVTYIFQRFASLMAFFFLASVVLYIRWRLYGTEQGSIGCRPSRFRSAVFYVLSLFSALLAMKTKENAFILPFVLALYEFSFFTGSIKRRISGLLPFFLVLFIVAYAFTGFFEATVEEMIEQAEEGPAGYRGIEREHYIITQFRVIVTYIRLLFLPVNQNIDYDYPVFHSMKNPEVYLSFFFLVAVFGSALYALLSSRIERPDMRPVSVGILWFFLALYVETSTVALPTLINEYRLYLPSTGAFFAAITGAFVFLDRLDGRRSESLNKAALVSLFLIAAILSVSTYKRNSIWRSETSLWRDTVTKSPNKARPHNNLGLALMAEGDIEGATKEYLKALEINPYYWEAHNNLGNAYLSDDHAEKAMEHYTMASKIRPDSARLHFNVGNSFQKEGMLDSAVFHYRIALSLEPGFSEAACNLGSIYASMGETEKAMQLYLSALSLDPENVTAYNNLGILYMTEGLFEKAVEQYRTALKHRPENAEAHFNLGIAFGSRGMNAKAIEHYKESLRLNPDNPKTHNNLGLSYLYTGQTDIAVVHFLDAVRLRPDYEKAHNNLGLAYEAKGMLRQANRHYLEAVRLKPDFEEARRNLGIILSKMGHNDKAKEQFDKLKELRTDRRGLSQ